MMLGGERVKILRSDEWEPLVHWAYFEPMQGPVYFFRHKRFNDIVALNVAKYIDLVANIVYFYNAEKHEVSVSHSGRSNNDGTSEALYQHK